MRDFTRDGVVSEKAISVNKFVDWLIVDKGNKDRINGDTILRDAVTEIHTRFLLHVWRLSKSVGVLRKNLVRREKKFISADAEFYLSMV